MKKMPLKMCWLISHLIAGIKSNIPICCVFYYCFWTYLFKRYPKRINDWEARVNVRYFRCPLCRIQDRVNLIKSDGRDEGYYFDHYLTRFIPLRRY